MDTTQLETREVKNNLKRGGYKETELDEWFRKSCVFLADETVENIALYDDYVEYCKERETPALAPRDFKREMPVVVALNWGMRLIKGRNAKGATYRGLSLISNREASATPHNSDTPQPKQLATQTAQNGLPSR
jgi:phage/plasmid-associated DNA primase